jgi:branched-chain amino acid transport system substrate-binding protein
MLKTISVVLRSILLAGTVGLALMWPATTPGQVKEVKIALIVPLSGPWARQGELERMGAQLAIEHINNAGGIKALGGAKMKLIVSDAGDNAEKAKNAAQRVLAQEPELVGGLGAWLSSFTLAVTEVTERAELPWLTLSYSDLITGRGFHYVFQTSPTGADQAEKALPTIIELAQSATGHKPTSVGIIMDNTAASVSFAKPMRGGGLEKAGITLLVDETFTPPLSDATPLVQKVRAAKPEFLFLLPTAVSDDKLLLEKLSEMGLSRSRLPVVGNGAHMAASELRVTAGAEIMEGVLVTLANWGGKGQEKLVEEFKKRYGEPWMTQDSLSPYGHVWILKEALEKAGVADRKKVAEAIRAMDTTDGPARFYPGGRLKFDDKGRRVGAPLVIVQWRNGEPVPVSPPELAVARAMWTGH